MEYHHHKQLFYTLAGASYFTPTHRPASSIPIPKACPEVMKRGTPLNSPVAAQRRPWVVIALDIGEKGPEENAKRNVITKEQFRKIVDSYLETDDVLTPAWLKRATVILQLASESSLLRETTTAPTAHLAEDALYYLVIDLHVTSLISDGGISFSQNASPDTLSSSSKSFYIEETSVSQMDLNPGPYLAMRTESSLDLHPVHRLYPDTSQAFRCGVYPLNDGSGAYQTLEKTNEQGRLMIPVPSRLYDLSRGEGSSSSLKGRRTAVKDVIDLKGVHTTAGSRAYAEYKGKSETSASCLVRLEKEGAAIVGKVKTAPFATSGSTIETTPDELYPFSPRGDGHQFVGATSSGSASAMATYDWLDFSIGTDTGGSIRHPAATTGLYANRPSTGLLPLDGVLPCVPWSDTVGIIARDPKILKSVLEAWRVIRALILSQSYDISSPEPASEPQARFKTLLIPSDDFTTMPENINQLYQQFFEAMERACGFRSKFVKIADMEGSDGLAKSSDWGKVFYANNWATFGKPFVEWYEQTHDGRFPPISSGIAESWRSAREKNWDEQDFQHACADLHRTKRWFLDLLNSEEQVIPLGGLITAPISGCPEYVVPIGQVPFLSAVLGKEELQTISVGLMAKPGADFLLLDVVAQLYKGGVIHDVKTGRTAF